MKLVLAVMLAVAGVAMVGCKAAPTSVACTVTEASPSVACTIDGVTLSAAIPSDVAAVVGLLAPATNGVVTAQSIARLGSTANVTSSVNTSTHVVTLTNPSTGKSASFTVAPK